MTARQRTNLRTEECKTKPRITEQCLQKEKNVGLRSQWIPRIFRIRQKWRDCNLRDSVWDCVPRERRHLQTVTPKSPYNHNHQLSSTVPPMCLNSHKSCWPRKPLDHKTGDRSQNKGRRARTVSWNQSFQLNLQLNCRPCAIQVSFLFSVFVSTLYCACCSWCHLVIRCSHVLFP